MTSSAGGSPACQAWRHARRGARRARPPPPPPACGRSQLRDVIASRPPSRSTRAHPRQRSAAAGAPGRVRERVADAQDGVVGPALELLPAAHARPHVHAPLRRERPRALDHRRARVRRRHVEALERQPDRERPGPAGAVEHARAGRQLVDHHGERGDAPLRLEQRLRGQPVVDLGERVVHAAGLDRQRVRVGRGRLGRRRLGVGQRRALSSSARAGSRRGRPCASARSPGATSRSRRDARAGGARRDARRRSPPRPRAGTSGRRRTPPLTVIRDPPCRPARGRCRTDRSPSSADDVVVARPLLGGRDEPGRAHELRFHERGLGLGSAGARGSPSPRCGRVGDHDDDQDGEQPDEHPSTVEFVTTCCMSSSVLGGRQHLALVERRLELSRWAKKPIFGSSEKIFW